MAPVSFWPWLHNSLNTSLFSGTTRYFRLSLYFFCPSHGNQPFFFPQDAMVSYIKEWYIETIIWDLSRLIGFGLLFFLSFKILLFFKLNYQVYSCSPFVTFLSYLTETCFILKPGCPLREVLTVFSLLVSITYNLGMGIVGALLPLTLQIIALPYPFKNSISFTSPGCCLSLKCFVHHVAIYPCNTFSPSSLSFP